MPFQRRSRPERNQPLPSWLGAAVRWLGRRPAGAARALAIGALAVAFGTNVLAFTVLNEGFAPELAGRANTALNLFAFGGGFVAQWGIGLVVDATRASLGVDAAGGLRIAFSLVLALDVLTYAWFAWGWRRHPQIAHASIATAANPGP